MCLSHRQEVEAQGRWESWEWRPRTPAPSTWSGVKATLEAVPEERSRMVDFPPYTTLCFCSVRCGHGGEGGGHLGLTWARPPVPPHPRARPGLVCTCSVLEILALVASFTCVCRTRPLPDLPRWPRLKPRSSW